MKLMKLRARSGPQGSRHMTKIVLQPVLESEDNVPTPHRSDIRSQGWLKQHGYLGDGETKRKKRP
jgi:hypothetical protein